jgi:hypothetical protein
VCNEGLSALPKVCLLEPDSVTVLCEQMDLWVSKKRTMDRWLKIKRKNTEDVNEGASCSKQSELIEKVTEYRK